jgi:hypothetical protein
MICSLRGFLAGASTLARFDANLDPAGTRRVGRLSELVSSFQSSVVRAEDGKRRAESASIALSSRPVRSPPATASCGPYRRIAGRYVPDAVCLSSAPATVRGGACAWVGGDSGHIPATAGDIQHRPGGPRSIWAPRRVREVGAHSPDRLGRVLRPKLCGNLKCSKPQAANRRSAAHTKLSSMRDGVEPSSRSPSLWARCWKWLIVRISPGQR